MKQIDLENVELNNIEIEKELMISLTKELGSKVSKILQKNYSTIIVQKCLNNFTVV